MLSDLHLQSSQDLIWPALKQRLESLPSGDRLVLAGDVLDIATGRTYFLKRHGYFFDLLRDMLRRGVSVDWIEGNHDFNLRPVFEQQLPGLRIAEQSLQIGPLWIEHGDCVDRQDVGYRIWRGINRSWLFRSVTRALPASWFQRLGHAWSRQGLGIAEKIERHWMPGHGGHLTRRIQEAMQAHARQKFDEGFRAVVMGHVHVLDELSVVRGITQFKYMNIGFPPVHGTLVMWDSTDGTLVRSPLIP